MVWHNYEFVKQKDSAFAIAEQGVEEQTGGTLVAEEGFALSGHRRDEEYASRKVHGTAAESRLLCLSLFARLEAGRFHGATCAILIPTGAVEM